MKSTHLHSFKEIDIHFFPFLTIHIDHYGRNWQRKTFSEIGHYPLVYLFAYYIACIRISFGDNGAGKLRRAISTEFFTCSKFMKMLLKKLFCSTLFKIFTLKRIQWRPFACYVLLCQAKRPARLKRRNPYSSSLANFAFCFLLVFFLFGWCGTIEVFVGRLYLQN